MQKSKETNTYTTVELESTNSGRFWYHGGGTRAVRNGWIPTLFLVVVISFHFIPLRFALARSFLTLPTWRSQSLYFIFLRNLSNICDTHFWNYPTGNLLGMFPLQDQAPVQNGVQTKQIQQIQPSTPKKTSETSHRVHKSKETAEMMGPSGTRCVQMLNPLLHLYLWLI